MIALCCFLCFALLTYSRRIPRERQDRLDIPGTCFTCGYNLSGLPTNHTCPECGSPSTPHYRTVRWTELETDPRMPPIILLTGLFLFIYYILADLLAIYTLGLQYRMLGYPWHVARRVVLANGPYYIVDFELWPINMLVPSLPLFAKRLPLRHALLLWCGSIGLILGIIGFFHLTAGPT